MSPSAGASRAPDGRADGGLWQFKQYWIQSLDEAELSGAVTGVERDVLFADLQASVRELPNVTVVDHSSGVFLRLPYSTSEK